MVLDPNFFLKVALALVCAAVISFALTPVVKLLAKKVGAMDVPKDERRMHKIPIPRMGGLAIFFGVIVSVLIFGKIDRELRGILLGAGGLVRAYSRGAAEAVRAAGVVHYTPGTALEFTVDYARYGAVEAFVRANAEIDALDFAEAVHLRVLVENAEADAFTAEIVERTDGRSVPARCGEGYLIRPETPKS